MKYVKYTAHQIAYKQGLEMTVKISEAVKDKFEKEFIEPANFAWARQVVFVPKSEGKMSFSVE